MNKRKLTYTSISLATLLLAPAVYAADEVVGTNLFGVAVVAEPDYYGSSHTQGVVGLYGRYQFENSERYILMLGSQIKLNLLNDSNWRAGPMILGRAARDRDVEDRIVRQMDKVDSVIQGGAFLQYRLPLSDEPMHQVVFGGDVVGGKNGTEAHLDAMYWQPFSKTLIGNIGLGMTYGNNKFMDTYFGVISAHDVSLFPSLGGKPYNPSSGVVGWNIPFALTTSLTDKWQLSVGGRYERLVSDAKDSPVVDQRGDANQWSGGIGLAYVFK